MQTQLRLWLGLLYALLLCVDVSSALGQDPTAGWNTRWRNRDGSLKDVVVLGGGINTSAGASRSLQESGWNYRIGAGYRLNRRYAALIEYNYDRFHLRQSVIDSNLVSVPAGANSGSVHLWSFTMEPTVQYFSTEHFGGYLIGGGGFYRKIVVTRFVCPAGHTCTNQPGNSHNIFSNNAGGANLGTGFAWRAWDHSNTKVFIEGRYVWVDNAQSPNRSAFATHTGYFPVTAGLRW